MANKKIWVNTIVNNEENFIWFAIMSVIDFVDKVLVWDTGSDDNTAKIVEEIKKIKKDKIIFREVGRVNKTAFTHMRQKMLEESICDWLLILDGDEIWWKQSIKKVVAEVNKRGDEMDGIFVPMVVPVGDIYHLQEEKAGKYEIKGKKGHISLKVLNKKIPGLHVDWPYGKEGFFDGSDKLIQEREDVFFLEAPFLHVTHLKRSGFKRTHDKFKHELGKDVPQKFKFPEVFYESYPSFISSPWNKMIGYKKIISTILSPARKLKRRII